MVLVFVLMLSVFLGGCGGGAGNGAEGADLPGGEGKQNGQNEELSLEAMGRYVEEPIDLSGKISGDGSGIYSLANGNLVVTDRYTNFMKTGDGVIWMTDSRRWRTKMLEEGTYIMSMAVGPDNTVALIYQGKSETEGGESADTEADSAEEQALELNPQLLIMKPDNTEIPVEVALTEDDMLDKVYISDGGRIFVTTRGTSNLYEVTEDGGNELFLPVEAGHPELIQFQGNLMVMDGYGYDSPVLYDMEKKEYIEDEVLEAFIETNYRDRENGNIDSYELYFFSEKKGLFIWQGKRDCTAM